jgi:hypothetical protein
MWSRGTNPWQNRQTCTVNRYTPRRRGVSAFAPPGAGPLLRSIDRDSAVTSATAALTAKSIFGRGPAHLFSHLLAGVTGSGSSATLPSASRIAARSGSGLLPRPDQGVGDGGHEREDDSDESG